MSPERLDHRFSELLVAQNERGRHVFEDHPVTTAERFEIFIRQYARLTEVIKELRACFSAADGVLREREHELIWEDGREFTDESMQVALEKIEWVGRRFEQLQGLPGAFGAYLLNETLRRFQGQLGFPELDEESYQAREQQIVRNASPYMSAWFDLELRATAYLIVDDARNSWEFLFSVADYNELGPIAGELRWRELRRGSHIFHLDEEAVNLDLVYRCLDYYSLWLPAADLLHAELEIWRLLLSRLPEQAGWTSYWTALSRLRNRCRSLFDQCLELPTDDRQEEVEEILRFSGLVTTGLIGAWQLSTASSWVSQAEKPFREQVAPGQIMEELEVLVEAFKTNRPLPLELVAHLLGNGAQISAAVAILAPILKEVVSEGQVIVSVLASIGSIRLLALAQVDCLVVRIFVPLLNELSYSLSRHELGCSPSEHHLVNDVANLVIGTYAPQMFYDASGWNRMLDYTLRDRR